MKAELVFGIRVKLECADPVAILEGVSSCGRTPEYIKMSGAIFAEKPDGFEVKWATKERPWPVDSDGFTFVPLYVTDAKVAHVFLVEQLCDARREIQRIRDLVKQI